jgi:hypothetical protein
MSFIGVGSFSFFEARGPQRGGTALIIAQLYLLEHGGGKIFDRPGFVLAECSGLC